MTNVFIGFIPWILFWSLTGAGLWNQGVTAGLLAALGLVLYHSRQHKTKTMEVVTLGYFAVSFFVSVILGLGFFQTYGHVLNSLTLALMAFGSLLRGSPFTFEYARESWSSEYWDDPLFMRTNQIITAVWGVIFSTNALLGLVSLAVPNLAFALNVVVGNIGIIAGIIFSAVFPGWFTKFSIAQEFANRDPWKSPSFDTPEPGAPNTHDAIIIGSGIGGLTAGALLAGRGLRVIVFEQHFEPGGFCTSWERGVRRGDTRLRYVFDAGVHDISGLGENRPVRNLLKQLDIEDQLDWRRMDHEYFTRDFHLRVPRDTDAFIAALGEQFPGERAALREFFAEIRAVYTEMYADADQNGGVPGAPREIRALLEYPKTHPHAYKWMNKPFGNMLDTFFQSAELKAFLSALTGYLSDNPSALTVGAMAPIFSYYFEGGYYPAGGSQKFADALVRVIEQHGGQVKLRTGVKRIMLEQKRAVGVELGSGEIHRAKAIISNADARRTWLELVGREHLPSQFVQEIEALKPSTSAFMVFLGVDIVPDILPITMVGTDNDGVGICTPSLADPSLAPKGHSSIVLLKLISQPEAATWDRRDPKYRARKRQYADEMIALAETAIPNLREHIVFREEGSPATMARYTGATAGAVYGPAMGQYHSRAKTPVERLYIAGSGAFPGSGIEAVVISGVLAADAVKAPAVETSRVTRTAEREPDFVALLDPKTRVPQNTIPQNETVVLSN